jgi:signal transduction histidine kinase
MNRLRSFALLVVPAFVVGWCVIVLELRLRYGQFHPAMWYAAALHVLCWLVPIPAAILILDRFLGAARARVREALSIAAICLVCAFVGQFAYGLVVWTNGWFARSDRPLYVVDAPLPTALRVATRRLETAMLFTALVLLAARLLQARRDQRERDLRAQQLETRLTEARLQLLRSQLNPHFLFNSLNSVAALVRSDAAGAEAMLARLSRFYRLAAETEGRQLSTVDEELCFIREYLAIETTRFGGRLSVELHADDASRDARMPTLLLQPLVENAVKHGIARNPGPGWIRVTITRDAARLRLAVENNGEGDFRSGGIGLTNTRARLREMYGDAHELRIESARGATHIEIRLERAA